MQNPTDNPIERDERQASRRDIYHAAFLLRQKLVPDLVPTILNYADKLETFAAEQEFAQPLLIYDGNSPYPVVSTPAIATVVSLKHPVRRVTFQIRSHDQGHVDDRDAGNWTWFSARIVKAGQSPPPAVTADKATTAQPPRLHIITPSRGRRPLRMPQRPAENRISASDDSDRHILTNDLAVGEFRWHTVEWHADSADESESRWVQTLQPGDAISVIAWARFPGWTNHVQHVRVKIYTVACCH